MVDDVASIRLVGPELWGELIEATFKKLLPRETDRGRAGQILVALHDKHLGITPRLAVLLLPLVQRSQDSKRLMVPDNPWWPIHERLKPGQHLGVTPEEAPLYSLLKLVTPLLAHALMVTGKNCLFCHHPYHDRISCTEYDEYDKDLGDRLKELAQQESEGDPLNLFWQERGRTLSQIRGWALGLPEAEMTALGFLLRLTEAPEAEDSHVLQRLHVRRQERRVRLQEGGVRGIRVTRRLEDVDRILISEMVNPMPVLIDRLLNQGYLILERDPRRKRKRDVLLAGLLPKGPLSGTLTADFVQACWFNFISRFSLLLHNYHLTRSELRWMEGDRLDRFRTHSFLLQDLSGMLERMPVADPPFPLYRETLLQHMRWIPTYTDRRAPYLCLPEAPTTSAPFDSLQQWLSQVWSTQQDNPGWRKTAAPPTMANGLQLSEFRFVHLMLFLPADAPWRREERGNVAARLAAALRLDPRRQQHLSVTWVPRNITSLLQEPLPEESPAQPAAPWSFTTLHHPKQPFFQQREQTLPEIANGLVKAWLQEIMREVDNA